MADAGRDVLERLMRNDPEFVGNGPDHVMTAHQATWIRAAHEALEPADRARFQKLIDDASSDRQRAYLYKGLAARNSMEDLEWFAKFTKGMHPEEEQRWLSLRHSVQQYEASCCPTVSEMQRANRDPVHALRMNMENLTAGHASKDAAGNRRPLPENDSQALRQRLVMARHGGHPEQGMAVPEVEAALNQQTARTGVSYAWEAVGSYDAALAKMKENLGRGLETPIGIKRQDGERHCMLVLDASSSALTIYDPKSGKVRDVSHEDVKQGRIAAAFGSRSTWDLEGTFTPTPRTIQYGRVTSPAPSAGRPSDKSANAVGDNISRMRDIAGGGADRGGPRQARPGR